MPFWTLWYHGIPAYGLPGAGNIKPLQAAHLAGFNRIFVCRESDQAGAQFVRNVAKRLKQLKFKGEVLRVSCGGHKDPSELHCAGPDEFKERWAAVLAEAEALDLEGIAAQKTPSKVEALVELGLRRSKIYLDEDSGMAIAQVRDDGVLAQGFD